MVLMTQVSSDGGRRRCDAKCYNAHKAECKCICGGVNHGVGREAAMANTRRISDDVVTACSGQTQSPNVVGITKYVNQGVLF
jgi:hypothetical protein